MEQPTQDTKQMRGFSLVELMVAILLGALITTGIVQMFSSNQENYQVLTGQSRLQENGRFAIEFLTRAARMAGFTGCFSEEADTRMALKVDGKTGEIPYQYDMQIAVEGFEATTATGNTQGKGQAKGWIGKGTWSPNLDRTDGFKKGKKDKIGGLKIASGADIFAMRSVFADQAVRLRVSQASTTGDLITEIPTDATFYEVGDVLAVTDCAKAAVFQVTSVSTVGANFTIQHSTGGGVNPGNATTDLSGNGTVFDVDSMVYPVHTTTFVLAASAGVNNRGNTPLSLYWMVGTNPPVELVEGVEMLQVDYGVDTNGDGAPNRYQTIQAVGDPTRIITIRFRVTVSSVDEVTDMSADGLLRRTFTKTIAVRNRIQRG